MQKSLQASLVVIALLLGCIVFGLFSRSARSQSPALVTQSTLPITASPGRYQLLFPSGNFEFMVDTQTGRVWYRTEPGSPWLEESPDTKKPPVYMKLPGSAKP